MRRAEKELVERLRRGDEGSLRDLFDRYFDAIYNFAFYRVGRDHQDAEDVTQETFLAAVKAIGRYRGDSGLYAWLAGIARRRLARLYRHRGARSRLETALSTLDDRLPEFVSEIESRELPDQFCESQEVREIVGATMSGLPPRYERLLRLKYVDDLSVEEICEREGATPKAVESALTRARELFRRAFSTVVGELGAQQG